MGWQLSARKFGWQWDWFRKKEHYRMETFVSARRSIDLTLVEWINREVTSEWMHVWCPVPKGYPGVLLGNEIQEITSDRVEEPPDWADSLVTSSMDLLTEGLVMHWRREHRRVGAIINGWVCVRLKEGG